MVLANCFGEWLWRWRTYVVGGIGFFIIFIIFLAGFGVETGVTFRVPFLPDPYDKRGGVGI